MKSFFRAVSVVLFLFIFNSCDKDESSNNTQIVDKNLLFVIAGQSNAEGNVFLSGLSELQQAIPQTSTTLSAQERDVARTAIKKTLGASCEIEPECVTNPQDCPDNPFGLSSADAVIDGLRTSQIDWRAINGIYQHKTVKLIAANYAFNTVGVLSTDGSELDNENCTASPSNTSLEGPFLDRYTTRQRNALAPGFGAETENGELSYGPELGFGMQIAKSVSNAIILKVSMGGSSLNDHWRKSGTLYAALIEETKKALAENNAELGGFIWFQGFNDQFEDAYCQPIASLYENNLRQLLANVRTDLSSPSLPVVIVEARNGGELPIIQSAQNAVVDSDANAKLVVSKDLSDCFHYDSGSQLLIGERIGTAMETLIRN